MWEGKRRSSINHLRVVLSILSCNRDEENDKTKNCKGCIKVLQILWLSTRKIVSMAVTRTWGERRVLFLKRKIIELGIGSLRKVWKWKFNPQKMRIKKVYSEVNGVQWSVETLKDCCIWGAIVNSLFLCFGCIQRWCGS